jgi:hypothetical protein
MVPGQGFSEPTNREEPHLTLFSTDGFLWAATGGERLQKLIGDLQS